jgi:hypothetical protein
MEVVSICGLKQKKNHEMGWFLLGLGLLAYEVFVCRMFIDSSYTSANPHQVTKKGTTSRLC